MTCVPLADNGSSFVSLFLRCSCKLAVAVIAPVLHNALQPVYACLCVYSSAAHVKIGVKRRAASRSRFSAMAAPQQLTFQDCVEVAKRHFGRDDVLVSYWKETKLGGEKPAGYLGDHKLVEVYATAGDKQECVSVFMKTIPENNKQAALIDATGAFRKEILFYDKIMRAWEEMEIIPKKSLAERRETGVVPGEPSWNSRCYIARGSLVVLENIAKLGYSADNSRDVYDHEHVLLAIKALAKFHAASLIYEEKISAMRKKPYRFGEEFPEIVQDTFYCIKEGHPGEQTTEAGVIGLLNCAKKLPVCADPAVFRLVEQRLPAVLRRMYDAVKPSPRFRNVLCHADLWQNNIMFQRDADGRPQDVALVDYQLMRYAPPAHDIYDLLHLTTRRALRQRYEQEWLDTYYTTLSETLESFDLDTKKVLSREDFDASLEEQRFAGRLSGVFCLHFVLSSEETLGTVFSDPGEYERTVWEGEARAKMICMQYDKDEEYRERIAECLMELLEKDVLV